MKAQVLRLDDRAHQGVESLLPWLVNGSLAGGELAQVEQHLGECARCQREVDWLRDVQRAYRASESGPDAMLAAYRKLEPELDRGQGLARWLGVALGAARLWSRTERWARWTIALEFGVILSLGVLALNGDSDEKLYRTLGATSTSGNLAVVFQPATPEAEIRRLVHAAGARIVDGPTQTGAYVLRVESDREAGALQALRSDRAVLLAQPLGRSTQ